MKKVSLLLTTLGGAMAGYLLSNKKLREDLSKAKNTEDAANTIGKHLKTDSKKFAKDVKDFYNSDEVQDNLREAKKYAMDQAKVAKGELQKLATKGKKVASTETKKRVAQAKKKATAAMKSAKKSVRKTPKKAKAKA